MEHLPGGSGGVWRDDDPRFGVVVRRPTGAWTPAVHELLSHLADAGLDGIPRAVGIDEAGREVLTYLPGRTVSVDDEMAPGAVLAGAAAWLRRYHDAVRSFEPGPRRWRQTEAALRDDQIICHNDTGAYNWIVDGDRFTGMIDWDQAGPGAALDDLAFLCWTGVPLYRPIAAVDAAQRVRVAAGAYGEVGAADLLDAVVDRMRRAAARIESGIERGDAGMRALRERGEPDRTRTRVAGFEGRLCDIRAAL